MKQKLINGIFVVDGELRTADGWCWPDSNFFEEIGVEDGEYPVELEVINNVPTRLIIHFDRQLDQSE